MAWIRIDDHFDEHPKMQRVGPIAWGYWLAGLAYCNRNLTDGFIPWNKARTLCSFEVVEEDGQLWELSRVSGHSGEDITAQWLIGLLLEVGLWEEVRTESGRVDGYMVHDYPDYQPLRAQVEADREANRKRVESHRKKNGQFGNEHGNDAVTPLHKHYNGVSNDEVTTAPNPNPNHKDEANASSTRARRIPGDFAVTEKMREWGYDHQLTDAEMDRVTEGFVAYWQGCGKTKIDWEATWRNWMLKEINEEKIGPATRQPQRLPLP